MGLHRRSMAAMSTYNRNQVVIYGGWFGTFTLQDGWKGAYDSTATLCDLDREVCSKINISSHDSPPARTGSVTAVLQEDFYLYGGIFWNQSSAPIIQELSVPMVSTILDGEFGANVSCLLAQHAQGSSFAVLHLLPLWPDLWILHVPSGFWRQVLKSGPWPVGRAYAFGARFYPASLFIQGWSACVCVCVCLGLFNRITSSCPYTSRCFCCL